MPRHTPCLALLLLASCWGAKDNALFDATNSGDVSGAGASAAGSVPGTSGTDSGSGAMPSASGNGSASGSAGATSASGGAGATSASGSGSAGSATGPDSEGGASGAPVQVPVITDCAMVEGATIGENGHCYRVNDAELDYVGAGRACAAAGGHLVTISSELENELTEQLHDGEHWIGASDGRADTMPGVGTYTWVDGSVWDYSYWEDDQPNAYETNCPDQDDESDCFEHCAFQTDEGDWNDRSCWHAIASVCEWDIAGEPPTEGSAGAGGAEP